MSSQASSQTFDVHEELASAPLSGFHIRLALLLAALILFDGYDTVNPSYAVHYLIPAWKLSPSQGGLLVSSGLFGFFFGAAGHGVLADRYGRRSVLLYALCLSAIATVLTPVVGVSLVTFCSIRFITGVGLGVLMPLATTYINEFAPRRFSNLMPVWGVAFGWALGATLASIAGIYLTPRFGWQFLYFLGVLAFPLLAITYTSLPESIRYLALQQRTVEVRALLSKLHPDRSAHYQGSEMRVFSSRAEKGSYAALLSVPYRRTSITIWIASCLSLFGVYALTGWIPSVMIQRGENFATGFSFGAIMQIASFLGALLGAYLIDRMGAAKQWMACLWFCGAISMALLAAVNQHLFNLIAVGLAGFGIPGAQFLLNNFTARSYETSIRASGVGAELATGRLGAILGPYIAGLLQQQYHSSRAMFVAVAATSLLASLAVLTLKTREPGITTSDPNLLPTALLDRIDEVA